MKGLEKGMWGGAHIAMDVSDRGAILNYDGAHGTIDEPIVPNSAGKFVVRGTHVKESGGPVRKGEIVSEPARYSGTITGQEMRLTVKLMNSNETVGTFVVTHGQRPHVVKLM